VDTGDVGGGDAAVDGRRAGDVRMTSRVVVVMVMVVAGAVVIAGVDDAGVVNVETELLIYPGESVANHR